MKSRALFAALLAAVGIGAAPATSSAATPWARVVSVTRVTADNNAVPTNPEYRMMSLRVSYRCSGPVIDQLPGVLASVYRPRTDTWYTGYGWPATCDGRTHTTPRLRLTAQYRDTKVRAGESVRVQVRFNATGGWRPVYVSRWATTVLGTVHW